MERHVDRDQEPIDNWGEDDKYDTLRLIRQCYEEDYSSHVKKVTALSEDHSSRAISMKLKLMRSIASLEGMDEQQVMSLPAVTNTEVLYSFSMDGAVLHSRSLDTKSSIYQPFPDHDYIRLLRLEAASAREAPLHSELVLVRLKENPFYKTLSYT